MVYPPISTPGHKKIILEFIWKQALYPYQTSYYSLKHIFFLCVSTGIISYWTIGGVRTIRHLIYYSYVNFTGFWSERPRIGIAFAVSPVLAKTIGDAPKNAQPVSYLFCIDLTRRRNQYIITRRAPMTKSEPAPWKTSISHPHKADNGDQSWRTETK